MWFFFCCPGMHMDSGEGEMLCRYMYGDHWPLKAGRYPNRRVELSWLAAALHHLESKKVEKHLLKEANKTTIAIIKATDPYDETYGY